MMRCVICGEEIKQKKMADGKLETPLSARGDHLAEHNPSPAQWTEAYNKIQLGKERYKQSQS